MGEKNLLPSQINTLFTKDINRPYLYWQHNRNITVTLLIMDKFTA